MLAEPQGGNFGNGFLSAGVTQALSPAVGQIEGRGFAAVTACTLVSATIGGTVSKITGGSFANGAVTGAFQQLFNDGAHAVKQRALLMVGDPGLGDHSAGRSFSLASETEGELLMGSGWEVETVNVSSVSDMFSALTNGPQIDRAYYFGHGGVGGLNPGENSGAGTNLYAEDARKFTPGRLNPGAEVFLYACNTGVGATNIANTLSYYLQRPVYGFSSAMHYTANTAYNRAPPYLKPPNSTPLYMRPDNGLPATRFHAYGGN